MSWLLEGIAQTLFTIVMWVIDLFMNLYSDFSLDIGYDTNSDAAELFVPSYVNGSGIKGLFDNIFPTAASFVNIFVITAYVIVIALFFFKLFQSMLGPLAEGEDPGKLVARFLLSVFLVTWSYSFFVLAEKLANSLYLEFKEVFNAANSTADWNFSGMVAQDMFENPAGAFESIGLLVLVLFFFFALLINLAKLVLETFERYVVLGVLFYTCPLAFATIATDSTREVFKKWCQMVFSQFLLMFFNLFFLGVFVGAMGNIFVSQKGFALDTLAALGEAAHLGISVSGYWFATPKDFVLTMLILIAWLITGTKIDEHLRGLGLSAARTGTGLAFAMISAAYATKGAAKAGLSAGKKIGGAIKDRHDAAAKTAAATSAAANAEKQAKETYAAKEAASRNEKGDIKPGAINSLVTDPNANMRGKDTADIMSHYGLTPDAKPFNTKAPDGPTTLTGKEAPTQKDRLQPGEPVNKLSDISYQNSTAGDGKVTMRDNDGNTLSEVGFSDRWGVPQGEAAKNFVSSDNSGKKDMIYAATSDIVAADSGDLRSKLEHSKAEYGGAGQDPIRWEQNSDYTLTGYNAEGKPAYIASPDYLARTDPDNGSVTRGNAGDYTYSIQAMDNNGSTPSFAQVNTPAQQPDLVRKETVESESYDNHGNRYRASDNSNYASGGGGSYGSSGVSSTPRSGGGDSYGSSGGGSTPRSGGGDSYGSSGGGSNNSGSGGGDSYGSSGGGSNNSGSGGGSTPRSGGGTVGNSNDNEAHGKDRPKMPGTGTGTRGNNGTRPPRNTDRFRRKK